jgi:GT2 family glycosyltransferase
MNALKNLKIQLPILTNLKSISYEVIVVDNNSTDGCKGYIKKNYPKIKLIELKKNIGTAAVNIGLKICKGKYILFMGDMFLKEDSILRLRLVLDQDPSVGLAIPYSVNYFTKNDEFTGEIVSRALYSKSISKKPTTKNPIEISTAAIGMIKKDTIEKIGNIIYDPDFFLYGEDIDLGLRIRLIGKRSVIVPGALIYHTHIPVTTNTFSKFYLKFLAERNITTTFFKTFSIHNILLFFPYLLLTRLLGSIRDLMHLNFQSFFGRNYALFWLLFHPSFVIKKRMISQKIRKVKDSYILKNFSEKAIFSL